MDMFIKPAYGGIDVITQKDGIGRGASILVPSCLEKLDTFRVR
jgi:hypothetical protein